MARFQTTGKFQNVRIPYNAFRRVSSQEEGLEPGPPQPMQPVRARPFHPPQPHHPQPPRCLQALICPSL